MARTVALVRQGDVDAARANRQRSTMPAFDAFVEKNQAVEAQSEEFSEAASDAPRRRSPPAASARSSSSP